MVVIFTFFVLTAEVSDNNLILKSQKLSKQTF